MALLSLDNARGVDIVVYLVGFIFYLLIVWVPCAISLYLANYYKPVSLVEYKYHWWKFKRQYIYLEIWFRTHVIMGTSAWVVLLLEPWDNLTRILYIIVVILLSCALGYVARKVRGRIPGDSKKAQEISGILVEHKTSRGNMHEFMRKATSRDGFDGYNDLKDDDGDGDGDRHTNHNNNTNNNNNNNKTNNNHSNAYVDTPTGTTTAVAGDGDGDGQTTSNKPNLANEYVKTNSHTENTMQKSIELADTNNS